MRGKREKKTGESGVAILDEFFTRDQKNTLFKSIQNAGLNPSDFRPSLEPIRHYSPIGRPRGSREYVGFRFSPQEKYYFVFGASQNGEERVSFFCPAEDSLTGAQSAPDGFRTHLSNFGTWLRCLKSELKTPDFWAEFTKKKHLLTTEDEGREKNSQFSADEVKFLMHELREVRQTIEHRMDLSAPQAHVVDRAFTRIEEAVPRMGRLDWRSMVLGVLLEIGLEKIITHTQWNDIMELVGTIFSRIFGTVQLPV